MYNSENDTNLSGSDFHVHQWQGVTKDLHVVFEGEDAYVRVVLVLFPFAGPDVLAKVPQSGPHVLKVYTGTQQWGVHLGQVGKVGPILWHFLQTNK